MYATTHLTALSRGGAPAAVPGHLCRPAPGLDARGTARAPDTGAAVKERSGEAGPDVRRVLLCAACRHPVTDDRERIAMADRHEHVCTNPHGFAYRIGCFRHAPGCVGVGPQDGSFSWFPGYTWQIAVCRRCHGHLGWVFRAGADRFHGLVLDRLVEDSPDVRQ
jgi:hypothetical protein